MCFVAVFAFMFLFVLPFSVFSISMNSFETDYSLTYSDSDDFNDYVSSNPEVKSATMEYTYDYFTSSYSNNLSHEKTAKWFDYSEISSYFEMVITSYSIRTDETYKSKYSLEDDLLKGQDFYYCFWHGISTKRDDSTVSNPCYFMILSSAPFHLSEDSTGKMFFVSDSDKPLIISSDLPYFHDGFGDEFSNFFESCGSSIDSSDRWEIYFNSNYSTTLNPYIYINGYDSGSPYNSYVLDSFTSFYSNITDLNLLDDYKFNKVPDGSLSETIDVKLIPQFDYDMDRFDSTTNQNEYFKFEITNNSTKAIQWLACIYDQTLLTTDTMYIDSLSSWTYMCKESYYNSSVKEDKGVFRTTWTYDGALNTGSYYYHVLLPGESYSDVIYWENVKISANKIYTFNVNAFFTNLNNPTENINPVVTGESSDLHSVTKCTKDYFKTILNYNGSTDGYRTIESCVFSKEFSVLTIPTFTTTVRNGNSIPNGGSNDAYKQRQNYETQSNINGMNTKINKNYVDPTILANSLNDVDIDFNNIGVDDVKGYIDYSQNFFKLIKMSFQTFPAIWTLVVFGLTAIIVIAIIRYIRG